MTTNTQTLIDEANEILEHRHVLPKTTAGRLERAVRTGNLAELTKYLRLAHLHDDNLEQSRKETAELYAMIAQEEQALAEVSAEIDELVEMEERIEAGQSESIELYDFLHKYRSYIRSYKLPRFDGFMAEIDHILSIREVSQATLDEVNAWIKRAKDFKQGVDAKRRQLPQQTRRLVAA